MNPARIAALIWSIVAVFAYVASLVSDSDEVIPYILVSLVISSAYGAAAFIVDAIECKK